MKTFARIAGGLLGGGPMPLPVLEQRLEQYLAAQPGRQAAALR